MASEESYKGYRLRFKRTSEISVVIWPSNSGLALETFAYASLEEGAEVARNRAHEIIDAEINR
jgi:hypothetical protein